MWMRHLGRHCLTMMTTALLGGLLGATLVRLAPGFGVDQHELDSRFNEDSLETLRKAGEKDQNILKFYLSYLTGLFQGDLGRSRSLGRPVAELLRHRLPVTLRSVTMGLLIAWVLGLGLGLSSVAMQSTLYDFFSTALSGLFLCLPAAALALMFLHLEGPTSLAMGLVVFPKVFRYVRNVLDQARSLPHIVMAKAKGLAWSRILVWHIVPPAVPQVFALAGVSVSMALGASIPVEVICDSPGIGQLAWLAAMGRDLHLLVSLTVLATLITMLANLASDLATTAWGRTQP